jgi:hypothetical protein
MDNFQGKENLTVKKNTFSYQLTELSGLPCCLTAVSYGNQGQKKLIQDAVQLENKVRWEQ